MAFYYICSMEYTKCKQILLNKTEEDDERIQNELGLDVGELFIASEDVAEMMSYIKFAHENDYDLADLVAKSTNDEFVIWAVIGDWDHFRIVPSTCFRQ